MLKSQENGKLPKYLCITAGVIGEEADDQSSVSPEKLYSFGSGVFPCLCTCDSAASQGFCLHPQLSGKETKAFRKEINVSSWVYCVSGYGRESVLKNSAVNPLLKQGMCLRNVVLQAGTDNTGVCFTM